MAFHLQPHEIKYYADKFSQKTYHTDVPSQWREIKELKDRVKRRDDEIARLKAKNSRLEYVYAQIRRML